MHITQIVLLVVALTCVTNFSIYIYVWRPPECVVPPQSYTQPPTNAKHVAEQLSKPEQPTNQNTIQNANQNKCKLYDIKVPQDVLDLVTIDDTIPPPNRYVCIASTKHIVSLRPPAARPKTIPPELWNAYTLGGKMFEQEMFIDEVYNGKDIGAPNWSIDLVETMRKQAVNREQYGNYPTLISFIYDTFDKWPVKDQRGIVVGSQNPWFEAALLAYGATHIDTIEYGRINNKHPQITTWVPADSNAMLLNGTWEQADFVATYSSLEHAGLGRYGDPIDPDGDLEVVRQLSCMIKPGGLLYFGVPFGPDCVVWNAHRIYGPARISHIIPGWRFLDIIDMKKIDFHDTSKLGDWNGQGFIVLQNLNGCF